LNAYRESELFKFIWPRTKALFNAKPEAWTLHGISE
jgi:(4S)-4-hydroxy-5-phosphonooxypentane-2,3-dione isomerase